MCVSYSVDSGALLKGCISFVDERNTENNNQKYPPPPPPLHPPHRNKSVCKGEGWDDFRTLWIGWIGPIGVRILCIC